VSDPPSLFIKKPLKTDENVGDLFGLSEIGHGIGN